MADHLVKRTLRKEALDAFEQLKEWLLKLDYEPAGNLKLWADETLVPHSQKLLDHLPDEIKTKFGPENDTRMIAIHFDEPDSLVPVQEGMKVLLIPMARAKIGDEELEELDYLYLTTQVPAEPGFHALLIMCKK